jgi:hypothetical protein
VWFGVKEKMNKDNAQKDVLLAAIEKNPDMDLEKFTKSMAPKEKLIKEKLLGKLQAGSVCTLIGLILLIIGLVNSNVGGSAVWKLDSYCLGGGILLAVGLALLFNFFVGKKMLAKEIEAEEKSHKSE